MKIFKILKWVIISTIVLILIVRLWGLYVNQFSPEAIKALENFENIKKIELGMTDAQVNEIMGKAAEVLQPIPNRYNYTQFLYDTNDDSISSIRVIFDSTMHVTEVYCPKED